jgi:hypothetical protein
VFWLAILSFLDVCELVILTRHCGWQRRKVIHYLTNARTLTLGNGEDTGIMESQMIGMNIMARYCRHLRSLDCDSDSSYLCVPRNESHQFGVHADPSKSDAIIRQSALHVDIRWAEIITNCSSTWNVIPLFRCLPLPRVVGVGDDDTKTRVVPCRILSSLLSCSSLTRLSIVELPPQDDQLISLLHAYTLLLQKHASLSLPSLTQLGIPLHFLYPQNIPVHGDDTQHRIAIQAFRNAITALSQLQDAANGDYLVCNVS